MPTYEKEAKPAEAEMEAGDKTVIFEPFTQAKQKGKTEVKENLYGKGQLSEEYGIPKQSGGTKETAVTQGSPRRYYKEFQRLPAPKEKPQTKVKLKSRRTYFNMEKRKKRKNPLYKEIKERMTPISHDDIIGKYTISIKKDPIQANLEYLHRTREGLKSRPLRNEFLPNIIKIYNGCQPPKKNRKE